MMTLVGDGRGVDLCLLLTEQLAQEQVYAYALSLTSSCNQCAGLLLQSYYDCVRASCLRPANLLIS
jgi:hypothetical protein